jgi:glutaconyl-CoA/methylmalonyl-CoA decarboxylase subunit gamma
MGEMMRFQISVGGDSHQVDVVSRDGDALTLLVDGVRYDLTVAGPLYVSPQRSHAGDSSAPHHNVSVIATPEAGSTPAPGVPQGHLTAPMPGLIAEVKASPGMFVQAGTVLVVIEAMKMENNISASTTGVVREVQVSRGHEVQRGQLLLIIDPQ